MDNLRTNPEIPLGGWVRPWKEVRDLTAFRTHFPERKFVTNREIQYFTISRSERVNRTLPLPQGPAKNFNFVEIVNY